MMGKTLREHRLAAGMTQEEVARHSGVASANIAAYERGNRPMSQAMFTRLVKATRCPSAALAEHASTVKDILHDAGAVNIRVFGSVARGTDTPSSDIDLLYDVAPGATAFGLVAAGNILSQTLGFPVELVSARAVPERKAAILAEAVPL